MYRRNFPQVFDEWKLVNVPPGTREKMRIFDFSAIGVREICRSERLLAMAGYTFDPPKNLEHQFFHTFLSPVFSLQ